MNCIRRPSSEAADAASREERERAEALGSATAPPDGSATATNDKIQRTTLTLERQLSRFDG
eukprot:346661-Prymnesium_polylepis.1